MSDYLLIFDFDGTLANSIESGIKHANALAKRFRYQPINDIEVVRQQSAVNYIYSQVKWYYLPFWAISMKRRLRESTKEIQLYSGIDQLILNLHENYTLGIISGNSIDYINDILNRYNLDYFSFKIPNNGAKKHRALKKLIKSGYSASQMIFIGDDVQDIESAKREKLLTIAVSWGSSSVELLKTAKADKVSTTVEELEFAIADLTKQDHLK